ncbi:hypothetical protein AYO20_01581 [Fonsecaea nubica]|uniref:Uncharacterized protein n=1 Tax=Fonsecaea nubica TaxID=856822 RepID=A0A178DDH0_9EURO|nr:hypothetical protein AYO20_01581 [Fonsecaea nubica]OAL39263.1 hypothetical protein AYO20_01581 [Fonsecaea nubica]
MARSAVHYGQSLIRADRMMLYPSEDKMGLMANFRHGKEFEKPRPSEEEPLQEQWERSVLEFVAVQPQVLSEVSSHGEIRREGERWASRTEDEGSLIIACCDHTVKFFEIWAGKSKGKKVYGLGQRAGVLGGSRVLEGWCDNLGVDEIGYGEDVIR